MKKTKKPLSLRTETLRLLGAALDQAHGGRRLSDTDFQSKCYTGCITVCYDCPITPKATAVCTTN